MVWAQQGNNQDAAIALAQDDLVDRRGLVANVGDLDWLALRCRRPNVRVAQADMPVGDRGDHRLTHAVSGMQAKLLALLIEHIDRARVGTGGLHRPTASCCQDEDRHAAVAGAPTFQNRKPVHFGETEIKDDRTVIFGVTAEPGLLAVAHALDQISARLQRPRDIARNARIVFHQQNARHFSLVRSIAAVRASTYTSNKRPSRSTTRNS